VAVARAEPTQSSGRRIVMVDDELLRQRQEVAGSATTTCDLCGIAFDGAAAVAVAGRGADGEPVEPIRVCDDCQRLMARDEVPFEAEIDAGLRPADDF
jgi:hypothetical protein